VQVLIIDDSATMRKIIKDSLGKLGDFGVLESENCNEGLAKLGDTDVDLILVDWNMPGMTGIDFTKTVRGDPALAGTPIVMITSNAEKQHVLSAVMAGVNDYMVKPFAADVFAQKISKALGL
jgi:two-component system chemotaxis response regulator CheY